MEIPQQLHDLDAREAFALAQGREDLVDEIDAERRALRALFACDTCGATFQDGIDAGAHESTSGHRVSWSA